MSDPSAAQAGKGSLGVPPVERSGRNGNGSVDPSRNVLDLVQAAIQRQDDLRLADNRRIEDLRIADNRRSDDLRTLTASYEERLQEAEAKRIDAIRTVDVQAVAVATERQTQAAGVLAANVAVAAETQRKLVADSAAALAEQLQQIIRPIGERIASLEKSQNELSGKTGVTDPQMAQLLTKLDTLTTAANQGVGSNQKGADTSRLMFAVIAAMVGLSGLVIAAISLVTR